MTGTFAYQPYNTAAGVLLRARRKPVLDLDFTRDGALDPRITFSRGSLATLVGSNGLVQWAPHNLALRSEEFDNAYWSKSSLTVSANNIVDPYGNLTAELFTESVDGGPVSHQCTRAFTVPDATLHTWSVWLKAATRTQVRLIVTATGTIAAGFFDLAGGTVSGITGAATITAYPGGWYRCTVTGTTNTTSATVFMVSKSGGLDYTGNGSTAFYAWGAQLNQGPLQPYNATTSAAYHGPRFDYDPLTLACKGLLIEEQRTNVILRSNDINHAAWNTTTNTTVSTDTDAGIDGNTTADTLTASGANGVRQQGVTTTAVNWTYSVYLKRKTGTGNIQITMDGTTWVTQAITSSWARYSVTQTGVAGTSNPGIRIVTSGDEVYVDGNQAEAGAFATSYIPTTTATVTRLADVATITGANFSSWFRADEGTFILSGRRYVVSALGCGVNVDDNTANNVIALCSDASANPKLEVTVGGASQASIDAGTLAANTLFTLVGAYRTNDFGASVGGANEVVDISGSVPVVDRLRIGANSAATNWNGTIARIAYLNKRVPTNKYSA